MVPTGDRLAWHPPSWNDQLLHAMGIKYADCMDDTKLQKTFLLELLAYHCTRATQEVVFESDQGNLPSELGKFCQRMS